MKKPYFLLVSFLLSGYVYSQESPKKTNPFQGQRTELNEQLNQLQLERRSLTKEDLELKDDPSVIEFKDYSNKALGSSLRAMTEIGDESRLDKINNEEKRIFEALQKLNRSEIETVKLAQKDLRSKKLEDFHSVKVVKTAEDRFINQKRKYLENKGYALVNQKSFKNIEAKTGEEKLVSQMYYSMEPEGKSAWKAQWKLEVKAWDNHGNATIVEQSVLDPTTGNWSATRRMLFAYEDDYLVMEHYQHWYAEDNEWRDDFRMIVDFVEAGTGTMYDGYLLDNEYSEYYDPLMDEWFPEMRLYWIVNDKNDPIGMQEDYFDVYMQEWIPEWKEMYAWHEDGSMKKYESAFFYEEQWMIDYYEVYDLMGNTTLFCQAYDSKMMRTFDELGNLLTRTVAHYDQVLNDYVNSEKITWIYNESGLAFQNIVETWDIYKSVWKNNYRYTDYYNIDYSVVLGYETEQWNNEAEDWMSTYIYIEDEMGNMVEQLYLDGYQGYYWYGNHSIYAYDDLGNLINEESSYWNEYQQSWFKSYDHVWVFDAENYVSDTYSRFSDGVLSYVEMNSVGMDAVGNSFSTNSYKYYDMYADSWWGDKYYYSYMDVGISVSNITYFWDNASSAWVVSYGNQTTFPQGYTTYGIIPERILQYWSGSEWVNSERYLDEVFTDKNGFEKQEYYEWDGLSWIPQWKYTTTLNAANDFTNELAQYSVNDIWVNNWQVVHTYNASGMETNWLRQNWDGANWVNEIQYVTAFNANDDVTEELSQYWTGTDWMNDDRYVYVYDVDNALLQADYEVFADVWMGVNRNVFTYDDNGNNTSNIYQENYLTCPDGYYFDAILHTCVEGSQTMVVLSDWETRALDFTVWGGSATMLKVANPDNTGINTSANVLSYTTDGTNYSEGLSYEFEEDIDLSQNPIFRLRVFAPQYGSVILRLENTDFSAQIDRTAYAYGSGWEELVFDFSDSWQPDKLNKLTILIDQGAYISGNLWYIDNFERYSELASYFVFDNDNPQFNAFGGAIVETVQNTDSYNHDAVTVGRVFEESGSETWAGFSFVNGNPVIDLSKGTVFSLKVRSEEYTSGTITLKIEDKDDYDNVYYQVDAYYYGYGSWETLYFDFSSAPQGLNYNQVVIFVNPGYVDWDAWYFDELKGPAIEDNPYDEQDPMYVFENINKEEYVYNGMNEHSGSMYFDWILGDWWLSDGWIEKDEYNDAGLVSETISKTYSTYDGIWYGSKYEYAYDEDQNLIEQLSYDYNGWGDMWDFLNGWFYDEILDENGMYVEVIDKWTENNYAYKNDVAPIVWQGTWSYFDHSEYPYDPYMVESLNNADSTWITTMLSVSNDTMMHNLYLDFNRYEWNWPLYASGYSSMENYNENGSLTMWLEEAFYGPLQLWIGQSKFESTYGINNCDVTATIGIEGSDNAMVCEGEHVLFTQDFAHYMWSTGETSANIFIDEPGYYNVMVIDSMGCSANAEIEVVFEKMFNDLEICNVSVEGDDNVITWVKPEGVAVKEYHVYKANSVSEFELIATVAGVVTAKVTDTESSPGTMSESYAISLVLNSGCESDLSRVHSTIHLTSFLGHSNENHLVWNAYEGADFDSYEIYRGTSMTNLAKIATVSNMNWSYTDASAPEGIVYYQLVAIGFDCSEAKSNINKGGFIASSVNENEHLVVAYPNPFTNDVSLSMNTVIDAINVYDLSGQLVMHFENVNEMVTTLTLSELNSGSYLLQVIDVNANMQMLKLMKK